MNICNRSVLFRLFFLGFLLFYIGPASADADNPLKIGEVLIFTAPYCRTENIALKIAEAFSLSFEIGSERFNLNPLCTMGRFEIKIIEVIKKFGELSVIRVEFSNGSYAYLITNMEVVVGDGI